MSSGNSNACVSDDGGKRVMTLDRLEQILGRDGAERLIHFWGGVRVSVPGVDELARARMRDRVRRAYASGATPVQVAERFGVSVRTAQRLRERLYSGWRS